MEILSTVFEGGDSIPFRYTCDGQNTNPPLTFNDIPKEAVTLALIIEDVDAPGEIFYHWVIWNIDPSCDEIEEDHVPEGSCQGVNSNEKKGYTGPCPDSGIHRYYFKLYALSHGLDIPEGTTGDELEEALEGMILDYAEMIALYGREASI